MIAALIKVGCLVYVGATACRALGTYNGLAVVCALWLLMPYRVATK